MEVLLSQPAHTEALLAFSTSSTIEEPCENSPHHHILPYDRTDSDKQRIRHISCINTPHYVNDEQQTRLNSKTESVRHGLPPRVVARKHGETKTRELFTE